MKKSDEEKTWEVRMHEARQMRKQGAGLLYQRVSLLIACYEDADFLAWHAEQGTNELDFLDDELSDTAVGFLAFRAVMNAYPKREQWINHNIRELIAMTMDAEAKSRSNDSEGSRVSWKKRALAAEAECERLRGEIARMKESLGVSMVAKAG